MHGASLAGKNGAERRPGVDGIYSLRPSEATQLTKTGFTGRTIGGQRFVVDWMTLLGWRQMDLLELSRVSTDEW